ncbi:MAG: hypothetical protein JW894_16145 [Bacteroidales bacterium]|nr:hypothetical protein [Bacteroidales bacterium]
MGYKKIDIRLSVHDPHQELRKKISKKTGIKNFDYQIIKKSLDARNKKNICWQYCLGIISDEIKAGKEPCIESLEVPSEKKNLHVVIVGMGPAGIFSALYLLQSGCKVSLIERGSIVEKRQKSILRFEKEGVFDPSNNYAYGEGGAGTFSDGKLTSRTKNISKERNFIYNHLIDAGAPVEIFYLTHPHLGSDNLFKISKNIRKKLFDLGCEIFFDTRFTGLSIQNNKIKSIDTSAGQIEADKFIVTSGHSAYDTYRILINNNIKFKTKNFALGFRAEHKQEIINVAQWGIPEIPGIKAAEYRLTFNQDKDTPVYSFCMCPGGIVVPSTPFKHTNIVNGMSRYLRDNEFANAAVVAGFNIERFLKRKVLAEEALDWLEALENSFFRYTNSYNAPASAIQSFIAGKTSQALPQSSYPFELVEADFNELLPNAIIKSLKNGLTDFSHRLKGYESGIILGLESKTSALIQAERHPDHLYSNYENLYIAGEASGWAGGIISSAADGLKIAQKIIS